MLELAAWTPFDGDAVFADKIESFPTGVMVCEIELDPETGAYAIERFTDVADCGLVINPLMLAGQLHGGIAHGLGNGTMEEAVYDEKTGQLLSGHADGLRPAARRGPAEFHDRDDQHCPRPTTSWA